MNKKNMLVFSMALTIVGGATAAVFAAENAVQSTKNKVVTVASKAGNDSNQTTVAKVANGKISDEEAVKMATKALKDYMGLDAKSFGEARVNRTNAQEDFKFFMDLYSKEDAAVLKENAKKDTANVIVVQFVRAEDLNQPMPASNRIVINEATGEIVSLTAFTNENRSSETTIDDAKVKTAVINFFDKQQKNVKVNTMKVSKTANSGTIRVLCDLEDGRDVTMTMSLKNYSVSSYEINYDRLLPLPSEENDYRENFREL
ncbi:hypothetical protein ABE237_10785 [Brevibacillus formosus]|uniref:hypothetical protein n=1 Tax=Brevibacillus TaxID=55080 RepID=UPI000D109B77|nr:MULTISPECIES: hypothetical protein [Brevibacillus]MBG9940939.1 hypothetical protein [Brevibacillus formosus]MED1943964.1 hypothetical protein [Brevibacillus formosus]MED1999664.1 hypothetical protein [Brevibacillus formosus]MED2082199.1 hypothetical protein [Brevibacillus formosus]PSK18876.1 hypothetical protein C7R94_08785 [Brevibacillus sp. NRRL NRS-603]